jgi:hypothetical protein
MPAIMLIALGGLATPSVRAMVSGRGPADSQGVLAADELSISFPGAPFALAAISTLVACPLLRRLA